MFIYSSHRKKKLSRELPFPFYTPSTNIHNISNTRNHDKLFSNSASQQGGPRISLQGQITRSCNQFSPLWFYRPIWVLAISRKLSISLRLLDLGQLAGPLKQVISSLQDLCLYTNTEKCTHNTNTKHSYPRWDSNPQSQHLSGQWQFMP
jgi:hypothetical protein